MSQLEEATSYDRYALTLEAPYTCLFFHLDGRRYGSMAANLLLRRSQSM